MTLHRIVHSGVKGRKVGVFLADNKEIILVIADLTEIFAVDCGLKRTDVDLNFGSCKVQ